VLTELLASASLLVALANPPAPSAPPPRKAETKASSSKPHTRELRRRTLTIDDASVTTLPELHVAGGTATVVTFQVPIADGGAIPGTSKELFFPIAQTDRTVIIVPKADLTAPVPLNISLTDGTVLTFQCRSDPRDADAQVDVIIALQKRAAQESAPALKVLVGQLREQLDECRATAGDAGTQKLASLLLAQSLDQPQTFTRHPLRALQKQNRLLAETRWAYRLLGLTYVVLTVENRDPERTWVLDHAAVAITGGGQQADIQVKSAFTEFPSLAPDTAGRVVIAFTTPASNASQKVKLTLYERDGNRSITLDGLDL
jgi:uncharacterized protein (TIGR02268 family)